MLYINIAVKKFSAIENIARRKLEIIDAVENLEGLKVPPSNHLEKLKGDRLGQYSIRVNRQYRICFDYRNGDFYNVEIVDYH
jgi:proteic killer suppression protein